MTDSDRLAAIRLRLEGNSHCPVTQPEGLWLLAQLDAAKADAKALEAAMPASGGELGGKSGAELVASRERLRAAVVAENELRRMPQSPWEPWNEAMNALGLARCALTPADLEPWEANDGL